MDVKNDEFVMVLRCDGRIVAISDEAEYHLGKSMVKDSVLKKKTFLFYFK